MRKLLIGILSCILFCSGLLGAGPLRVAEALGQIEAPPEVLFSWNLPDEPGYEYELPNAIAADSSGNIFVGTASNGGAAVIYKYDSSGNLLTQWVPIFGHDYNDIYGIAFDSSDNVYIAARYDWSIYKYSSNGSFINDWINPGWEGSLKVINPIGIAIDAADNLYVIEFSLYDFTPFVTKYAPGGLFVTRWGINGTDNPALNLWEPSSIVIDSSGFIYLTDTYNHSVHKFDSSGTPITTWGSEGAGQGQFNRPHGIAVDSLDNVYVYDTGNQRVQKFDTSGNFLNEWDVEDIPIEPVAGALESKGITVGSSDNIYVLNQNRILVFGPPLNVGSVEGPSEPVQINTSIIVDANFTGPGSLGDYTAVWDWGDGTTSVGIISENPDSGYMASGSHEYNSVGVFTVVFSVTDGYGRVRQSVFQYVVVYDPSAGFVTGGGWIYSPAGSYLLNQSIEGKATFGFVSKYKKGASLPTGQTVFQFAMAGLNFHSETYDWLVVAGARAQFKGSGTVNGVDNYGFKLTAIDGDLPGGGGVDKFRIKIWDKGANDMVIYDNQSGLDDSLDPQTVIGGGSIVIHK